MLLLGTLVATRPATATTGVREVPASGGITERTRAAASYLGKTPQQAAEFFKRQNADLDAIG